MNLHPPKSSSISDRWAGWRCRQRHGREQIEPGSRPATLMSSSTRMKKVILWVAATVFSSQTLYLSAEAAILVVAAACDGAHAESLSAFRFQALVFQQNLLLTLHIAPSLIVLA